MSTRKLKYKRGVRIEHRQSSDVCFGCGKTWPCPAAKFAMKRTGGVLVDVTVRIPIAELGTLRPDQRKALLDGLTAVMMLTPGAR